MNMNYSMALEVAALEAIQTLSLAALALDEANAAEKGEAMCGGGRNVEVEAVYYGAARAVHEVMGLLSCALSESDIA